MLHTGTIKHNLTYTHVDNPDSEADILIETRSLGKGSAVYIGFPLISALAWRPDLITFPPFSVEYYGLAVDDLPGGWYYAALSVMASEEDVDSIIERLLLPRATELLEQSMVGSWTVQ